MRIVRILAALGLLAAATAANAEVSSTWTLTSDYDFRGFTQSAKDPAVQASLDYAAENGWYLGAWASNVDFGDADVDYEVDFYTGFSGGEEDGLGWDVGLVYYAYPDESDFNYAEMDPQGYACPVGSHIRRMNLRDTGENMQRRKMIRRGGTYGPHLPEGSPEDGVERGIAAFIGCASLVRQFEFTMNVWTNDPDFKSLGNERDPIIGTQDGTFDFTIPRRPIKKKVQGLPAFTTVRGGAYFFLPGIRALRFLADGAQATAPKPSRGQEP